MSELVNIDVVLPCYNEISILRSSVERTLQFFNSAPQYNWHLVIADNGSTDRTDELAKTLAEENDQVSIISLFSDRLVLDCLESRVPIATSQFERSMS